MVKVPPSKRPRSQPRKIRLEDIARHCDVSIATVSRALSSETGVNADLRDRIREAARKYNYALPSPVTGRRVIVAASAAAMLDYVRNQFTFHVIEGIVERAGVLGMQVSTRTIADAAQGRAVLAEALAAEDVVGLLFLTLDDEAMLEPTRGFSKPVILVNGDDPSMRLSSIAPRNRAAAALATDHLRGLGHERILFLMRRGRRTIERRFEGWRDRMVGLDAAALADLTVEVDDWLPELAAAAIEARIAARGLDFSAVLTAGDSLAVGALMALAARGIPVPGAVSVIGMDGLPQAAFLDPPLTAIQMPMRQIGSVALDLLRDKVSGAEQIPRRVELACEIMVRGSTARRAPT